MKFVKGCNFSEMSKNQNSIHVLVKIVAKLPASTVKQIYESLLKNFETLCCDKNGVCLVKAILDSALEDIAALRGKIIENAFTLSVDPFGNYVI